MFIIDSFATVDNDGNEVMSDRPDEVRFRETTNYSADEIAGWRRYLWCAFPGRFLLSGLLSSDTRCTDVRASGERRHGGTSLSRIIAAEWRALQTLTIIWV